MCELGVEPALRPYVQPPSKHAHLQRFIHCTCMKTQARASACITVSLVRLWDNIREAKLKEVPPSQCEQLHLLQGANQGFRAEGKNNGGRDTSKIFLEREH